MTGDEEVKLVGESARGAHASRLLADEMFVEAFETVEKWIIDSWKESPIRDTEGQLDLRLMHKVLIRVRKHIEEVVQTGKMANQQLEHERSLKERARAAVREFRR